MYIWWNHSQKTVLVIKTVLKNFKSDQTVLIIVTVLIILSCIIWPMYSTYNSDILKKWETVLIIERSEYVIKHSKAEFRVA